MIPLLSALITLADVPLQLNDMVLLVLFFFFVLLAFLIKEPFLFAIASFVTIIFGIDILILFIGNTQEWAFGIIGFALFFFGLWLLIAAYQYSMEKRQSK
jgi:hypothetical protein